MSSDDASDDSGFDKEAEREKLREKYEDDQKDRENTRRMSELLLQGATMTGKHCDECGDPIFRYDGQEFCPTCQHEAKQAQSAEQTQQVREAQNAEQTQNDRDVADEGAEAEAGETDASDAEQADSEESHADEPASDESASGEPRVEIDGIRVADQQPSSNTEGTSRHADHSNLRQPPSQQGGRRTREHARDHAHAGDHGHAGERDSAPDRVQARDARARGRTSARDAGERTRDAGDPDLATRDAGDPNLATARESLVRTLTDLARRAEENDDVARTRELLAATREAAEALEALDRANR